jgi:DNA-binding transcriptional MerR regulator
MAMKVNELAKRAGVQAHVVRYYTRAGLLRPRRDPANRYHLYRDADVTRLRFIRRAKLLGFRLLDISQILRDADRRQSPCPKTRQIILDRLKEGEQRLSTLLALQGRMQKAAKVWRKLPDALPDGDSICHLVEAVTRDEDLGIPLR